MSPKPIVSILAAAALLAVAGPAHARRIDPPSVPGGLQVPAGNRPFLVGHAVGTQNYVCLPSGAGFAWTLFTPQATLWDDEGRQITTHFFSPNAAEDGLIRPRWQSSRDSSAVWARLFAPPSTDAAFVAPGALPWLLLQIAGVEAGPEGGTRLTGTTFIQRVNTSAGKAPAQGCAAAADVGRSVFEPYSADYYFWRSDAHGEE